MSTVAVQPKQRRINQLTHQPIYRPMVEVHDGEVTVNFHPGQRRCYDSKRRFVFLFAGTQGGKTSFGPWWLNKQIDKYGPGDYLAVTATYDLFRLKFLPEIRKVFEHTLGIARYWPSERVLEIRDPKTKRFLATNSTDQMWARIILRSSSAGVKAGKEGAGGLESGTAKAALLDECGLDDFTYQAWEAIQRRLSLSEGPVLGMTSLYNYGWLKFEVFDPWQKGDPTIDVIQFDSIENPAFPITEYERQRKRLPTWKFNMMYRGQFDRPAGMIFSDFDEDLNKVKGFPIPVEWPRVVGIDWGPLHTVTLWLAEEIERAAWYLYRVTLEGNMVTKEHARKAKARAQGERVILWVGGAPSEKQYRMDWKDNGIDVKIPVSNDIEVGVDAVIQGFKEKRLFIFEELKEMLEEIMTFSRELDAAGQPTEKIKDEPKYHRIAALRYAMVTLLKQAKSKFAETYKVY